MPRPIYPLNDFGYFARFPDISATTGAKSYLSSSAQVTCFLASSNSPSATALDPTLSMTAIYVTTNKWLIFFDAAALTVALLSPFTTLYLICQYPSGFRVYIPLEVQASRPATAA